MKEKKITLSLNGIVLFGAFVLVVLVGTLTNRNFLSVYNILSIFQQMSEKGIMVLGLTVVILTGGIDISCGSVMGLCAVVTGVCLTNGVSVPLTLLLSLLVAVLLGVLNGVLVAIAKVPPMIATLGTQMLLYGIALVLSKGSSISGIPETFYFLGQEKIFGIPLQAVLFIALWLLLGIVLKKKRLGKYIYSIGNNIKASLYSGIATTKIAILAYVICAVFSGIAGNIQVSRVATARADMGSIFLMECISAIVLGGTSIQGGTGGVTGSVVGILIFAMIGNVMNLAGITSFWKQLAAGGMLIMVVVFNKVIKEKGYEKTVGGNVDLRGGVGKCLGIR